MSHEWLFRHGHAPREKHTPEYKAWNDMLQRCSNPAMRNYRLYGGRGIRVCVRWQRFTEFLADVGPRPSSAHSLDRIKNAGHYTPRNVRWATRAQQSRNRRDNVWLSLNGDRRILLDWAKQIGITSVALKKRVRRWGVRKALTTPAPRRTP